MKAEDDAPKTSLRLLSGQEMPIVGFGIYQIPKEETTEVLYNAIKNGYRLIDSASIYHNEKEAGVAIKRCIDEGIITREDLFVTSKLWNNYHR